MMKVYLAQLRGNYNTTWQVIGIFSALDKAKEAVEHIHNQTYNTALKWSKSSAEEAWYAPVNYGAQNFYDPDYYIEEAELDGVWEFED